MITLSFIEGYNKIFEVNYYLALEEKHVSVENNFTWVLIVSRRDRDERVKYFCNDFHYFFDQFIETFIRKYRLDP